MRSNHTDNHLKLQHRLLISLGLLVLLSISCSLPEAVPFLGGAGVGRLEQDLISAGISSLEEVVIGRDGVFITYAMSPDDSLDLMINGWVSALSAAGQQVPGAPAYTLHTTQDGEPYLDVKAAQHDLEGYLSQEISLEQFLEKLEVIDQRPWEARILADLLPLALDQPIVALDGNSLLVTYQANPALSAEDLSNIWWEIFGVLGRYELPVENLQIQAVLGDGSAVQVEARSEELAAYVLGELSAVEFLALLQLTGDLTAGAGGEE